MIIGSGWGGYTFSRKLTSKHFSPLIISPRTYFLFTPLLTDAAGGSLDYSQIIEPVRDPKARIKHIQAKARSVDFARKVVTCESAVIESDTGTVAKAHDEEVQHTKQTRPDSPAVDLEQSRVGEAFDIPYDKLVIAVGAVTKTFDTPGVKENAIFFKDIGDAQRVKKRVRECFELAMLPTTSPEMKKWLLHFAIVGAGPTGSELAASIRDLIALDFNKRYPELKDLVSISLYDVAPNILSMFDEKLSQYAMKTMKDEGIDIRTAHHVESIRWGAPGDQGPHVKDPTRCLTIKTKEGGEEGIGLCVWVTGNTMDRFITQALDVVEQLPASPTTKSGSETNTSGPWKVKKNDKTGTLAVDGHLRVQVVDGKGETVVLPDVFAIGDNATPELSPPPATAQATYQEAKWLASRLGKGDIDRSPPFSFKSLGVMAYIGDSRALMQFPDQKAAWSKWLPRDLTGRVAWMVWNSAYITMSMSWKNKLRVGIRWLLNRIFGKDVTK